TFPSFEEGKVGLTTSERRNINAILARNTSEMANLQSRTEVMSHLGFYILFLVVIIAGCTSAVRPAEVVLRNGTIYTANDRQPKAEAVAISGGKIVFVGSNADLEAYAGAGTKVIDLQGNTATPGFTDSHYHLYGVGQRERTLNLDN